ncbi:BCD family MFS transporter [Humitalea sp. 24SJ18S-53]|uniref:BCD family MFS transporter n=1 Tax=Humitalea sp. 24SJ18S-53 TaxID=3422307 RepID=UPI003D675914
MMQGAEFGWFSIVRLGLVQTALGAVVVLTTSVLNRLMVVEFALPATLSGLLVGLYYAMQMLRPRMGHGSDVCGRRTPWIVGGMATLCLGAILAAIATGMMDGPLVPALALGIPAFLLVGAGVSASGTALLVLLAARVVPARKAAAASIVWIMMIAGFVLTTAISGRVLDPYSPGRLLAVTACVAALAFALTLIAVFRLEGRALSAIAPRQQQDRAFRDAVAQVWTEPEARHFTLFVFVAMLAYSAQDLVLEPFAGSVFGMTLGQTTQLASIQHGGVLVGMVLFAVIGRLTQGRLSALRLWIQLGCVAAAGVLLLLGIVGMVATVVLLPPLYAALGLANGIFAAAAISAMMQLAARGNAGRDGVRMGMFGAAQAVAFGLGGLAGTILLDVGRLVAGGTLGGYATVFVVDAVLFLAAGVMAQRIGLVGDDGMDRLRAVAPATHGG